MKKMYTKSIWLILSLVMSFLLTEVTVTGSKIVSGYIDLLKEGTFQANDFDTKLMISFIILGFILAFFKKFFSVKFSQEIIYFIKASLQEKVLFLKAKYFEENNSGTVINKLNSDIAIIDNFFSSTISLFLQNIIIVFVVGASIFKLDFSIGLFVSFVCVIIFILCTHIATKIEKNSLVRRGLYDDLASVANDQLKGIHTIRSYNSLEREIARVNVPIDGILENEYVRVEMSRPAWFLQKFTGWFPNVIVPPFLLYKYIQGDISVGDITFLILILNRLFIPFMEFPTLLIEITDSKVSFERIKEIFDFEDELSVGESSNFNDFESEFAVSLENLEFYYEKDFKVLNNVNLAIKKGQSVAIVGSSGCGKSTIFKILCGFNKVEYGKYKLFENDTNNLTVNDIRKCIAIVSQEDFVINGTILENIKFGDKNATLEEVMEVCKKANIHDTIMLFENKYDTIIGDGGQVLSGGERQRISIARALLKKAPIMLLDEPTSALDVKNEKIMIDTFNKIKGETTIITIAHRLSTILDYDNIVVMDSGNIVEMGNKDELMSKKGHFYLLKLAEEQGGEVNV